MAPAKLTFSLRVTGIRHDGLHLIDAEMATLQLCDRLEIRDGGSGIIVDGPFGARVPTGRANLVSRALRLVKRDAAVRITKSIPSGGGLGGGSADAAAILRWAGVDDRAIALQLGADVPFCVLGGRARVRGIGDELVPLPFHARPITLVVPPLRVPTAAVYRAWDELGGPTGQLVNDLEPAAIVVEPRLRYWRDRILELTGERPILAGSGATWWLSGARGGELGPLSDDGATVIETSTATEPSLIER